LAIMPTRILVVGGQRSGKSRHAEAIVAASGLAPVYIATATAGDDEMATRIAAHRGRRGPLWRTVEEPLDVAGALLRESGPGFHVLVDCLTVWLSNLMSADRAVEAESEQLIAALARVAGPVVLVSNEVGLGIVPDNALARRYADELGILNQKVAAAVDRVVLMAAGLPIVLKSEQPNTEVII
jgi:adenosylcobinamide kinase/adenosylcobinamide-phosphate guanylyltransferase